MPGTVLGGRYLLDAVRSEPTAANNGAMQCDATDLSSTNQVSVRIGPLSRLVDPLLGSTTANDALAVFEAQCAVAESLKHPCIETIYDHGEATLDGERYVYTVAERLAGGSLREFIDRGRRLTPSQALVVGVDACRALDAAAKQGVIHGDIRPSRLVFGLDRRVRVVGFGAPLRPVDSLNLDQALFAAPELADGSPRTASSDVYALALVLVEAMTGEVPFAADTPAAAFTNRLEKLLPVSADFGALAQVLERAGRPSAPERFTAREFGQALVQAAEKLPRPTPIDIVGTGLFDTEVADSDPSKPTARPSVDDLPPVQNEGRNEPILIRTTPHVGEVDITAPKGTARGADISGSQPLTIGGDETGPTTLDIEQLHRLAAEDPTEPAPRVKKRRWGRRIAVAVVVVGLLAGGGAAAYVTVLNPKNPVPQLAGLTEAEARNQVSRFGWKIAVVKQRSDEVQAGQVISTDPVLGANVAKRDTLTLVVSEGPTLSVLEEFSGMTADAAKTRIAELGLQAAPVDVPDETVAPGVVVSWSVPDQAALKVGDSVVKGTTIALNVSTGPALRDVPDLTKLTVAEATAKLTEMGLVLVEGEKKPHPEIAADRVSAQVPAAGEKLAKGGTVTVTVSAGQQTTLIPSIYGKDFATVKERLEKYNMVIGAVTGDKARGLREARIDGKKVKNFDRVIVGKTVDLTFP